jgi:hypothetical protein
MVIITVCSEEMRDYYGESTYLKNRKPQKQPKVTISTHLARDRY